MPLMNKSDFNDLNEIKSNDKTINNNIAGADALLLNIKNALVSHYVEVHPDDKAGVVQMAEDFKTKLQTKVDELQALIDAAP